MIKEIDQLLQHWADQLKGRGMRQCSPLGRLAEFGGVMPPSGPRGHVICWAWVIWTMPLGKCRRQ